MMRARLGITCVVVRITCLALRRVARAQARRTDRSYVRVLARQRRRLRSAVPAYPRQYQDIA
eukprot:2233998-Rhodomonas_salina.1